MLKFVEKLEKSSKEKPVFTVEELRKHLPEGFLKQLSKMEEINAQAQGVKDESVIDFKALLGIGSKDQKASEAKSWGESVGQAFNSLTKVVFGDYDRELDQIGHDYLDHATHRVDVDSDDGVKPGTYVQCSWRDGGVLGAPTHIEVEIGNFCRDEEGEIIPDEGDKNFASLVLSVGESGFDTYFVGGSGTDPVGSWEAPDTQNMKDKTLDFLEMASKLDKGEYVSVRDARLALESGRWKSVNESLRVVDTYNL